MEDRYSIATLLALRKLTRAVAEVVRSRLTDHMSALAPLFRPSVVLGEYLQWNTKATVKGADVAYRDLQTLYGSIASASPFNLLKELKPPLDISGATVEIIPIEYQHLTNVGPAPRTVTITHPLRWILTYAGYTPAKLRALLENPGRSSEEVRDFILHILALHIVVLKQPGIAKLLEALHFRLSTEKLPEFAELPITCISSTIPTHRPHDEVIIESTEISGKNVFEEVVAVQDVLAMHDPLCDKLVDIARTLGGSLLPAKE